MTVQQSSTQDDAIRTRLEALDRFAGVIAHDLGNVILPSSRLSADASPDMAKLHGKLQDLAEHITSTRRCLDIWRDHARVRELRMDLGTWWMGMSRLLGAVFDPPARLRLDRKTDDTIEVDPGQLARVLAHVLIALRLQATSIKQIDVGVERNDELLRVTLNVDGTDSGAPSITPPTLDNELLGRSGRIEEFTASRIVLSLGPRD